MGSAGIIECFSDVVTVKRTTAGSYGTGGVYVPGTESTFDVDCSVQPLSGDELKNLPEGQRTRSVYKAYCAVELKGVDTEGETDADHVVWLGRTYEVQNVEYWRGLGMNHWRVLLIEQDET